MDLDQRAYKDWLPGQLSIFEILEEQEREKFSDRSSEGHGREGENGPSPLVRSAEGVPAHGGCNQTGPGDGETSLPGT